MMFWEKNKEDDKIWWKIQEGVIGEHIFSFDKKVEFNLFRDYPWKLTEEQQRIFDAENPFWADFFSDRRRDHGY